MVVSGCLSAEHELPGQGCLEADLNIGHINRGRTPTAREEIVLFSAWVDGARELCEWWGQGRGLPQGHRQHSEFPMAGSI